MAGRTVGRACLEGGLAAYIFAAFAALLLLGPSAMPAGAQERPARTIEAATEGYEALPGIFTLYRHPRTGVVLMAIRADQLAKDYIHYAYTENGVVEAGHYRGLFRANQILRFERHFERIEIRAPNLFYYFDPENALARSAGANAAGALLAALDIIAQSTDGKTVLVNADFLLGEALAQVRPSDDPKAKPGEKFTLGRLAPQKTRFIALRNYPSNLDAVVDYTFDAPYPQHWGGEEVWDARAVTIRMQHSLIEIPSSDYEPRIDDFRVGYFTERRTHMTDPSSTPYRDLIQRWNLKKKDPAAAVSEPVKKITFWIENTTPVEFRPSVEAGVLSWNAAFETAGFKDALEVKVQPDDADWDAGDVRYNVIRWTASPDPPFAGYGPRFTNPLTGEIIGADVMLEFDYVTGRILRERIFEEEIKSQGSHAPSAHAGDHELCRDGDYARRGLRLGLTVLASGGAGEVEVTNLIHSALKRLVAHEVGHTLGLSHNMKGSTIRPLSELHDRGAFGKPLTGSIMDYLPINVSLVRANQGRWYQSEPGPYDHWAIEVGYRPPLDDPDAEKAAREALLARSTEGDLAFGNDADDMRVSRRGIDPRVMIYDLSDDPVGWARERMTLTDETMGKLLTKLSKPGESYQTLRQAYLILLSERQNAARVAVRQVGGVHVERALQGQPGAKPPFTPVPYERQIAALDLLAEEVFAPDAFEAPEELLRHLQVQRRGYDLRTTTEDPKPHESALATQREVLSHLLHPVVLARLTDTRLYGNRLSSAELLMRLNEAVAGADTIGEVNPFRQNLQIEYARALSKVAANDHAEGAYDAPARSAARAALEDLNWRAGDAVWHALESAETRAHRRHLSALIAAALD